MTNDSKQVFLVSGQTLLPQDSGGESLSSLVEQHVVVAQDSSAAYVLLAEKMPHFKPVGLAALDDYERAASKIKDTLKGVATGWGLILAQDLST